MRHSLRSAGRLSWKVALQEIGKESNNIIMIGLGVDGLANAGFHNSFRSSGGLLGTYGSIAMVLFMHLLSPHGWWLTLGQLYDASWHRDAPCWQRVIVGPILKVETVSYTAIFTLNRHGWGMHMQHNHKRPIRMW